MSIESTEWAPYEQFYMERKDKIIEDVFPIELEIDNCLSQFKDDPLPIVELKRALKYAGTFEGQSRYSLLEIIRSDLLTRDQVEKDFPQFLSEYTKIKKDYDDLCTTLQSLYSEIYDKWKDIWNEDQKHIATVIQQSAGEYSGIIFSMRQQKCTNVKDYFKITTKIKWLEDKVLNPQREAKKKSKQQKKK